MRRYRKRSTVRLNWRSVEVSCLDCDEDLGVGKGRSHAGLLAFRHMKETGHDQVVYLVGVVSRSPARRVGPPALGMGDGDGDEDASEDLEDGEDGSSGDGTE